MRNSTQHLYEAIKFFGEHEKMSRKIGMTGFYYVACKLDDSFI
jgi:hypothetical protein